MRRESFENEMKNLQKEILIMGSLVEEMIFLSTKALLDKDRKIADKVIVMDEQIDSLEKKIENQAIIVIATQQPLAKDLRFLISILKIIPELERMADNSVDIAKAILRIEEKEYIKPLIDIPKMAELVQAMVKKSIEAYVEKNLEKAEELAREDDIVDAYHKQIFRELITYMIEDPKNIKQSTSFLFISRYLERIADRATNIGEITIYLKTGEHQDLNA